MNMYDTHIHTRPFSTDSRLSVEDLLEKQRQTGLGVVLTEHIDYDFPPPDSYGFEPEEYFEAYHRYRNEKFLLGVEVGMQRSVTRKNEELIRKYPFDMVIVSIHAVCGKDLYSDSYFRLFSDKKAAYTAYLETMYENLKFFEDFDTLAHIDYVCRRAPYRDSLLHYEDFQEEIDKILILLAEKKKSLEINTRLFGNQEAVMELRKICRQFAQYGGRTATVGSDAHNMECIGSNISNACRLSAECGLQPVYYRERRAYKITL